VRLLYSLFPTLDSLQLAIEHHLVIGQQLRVEDGHQIGQNPVRVGDATLVVVIAAEVVQVQVVAPYSVVLHGGELGEALVGVQHVSLAQPVTARIDPEIGIGGAF